MIYRLVPCGTLRFKHRWSTVSDETQITFIVRKLFEGNPSHSYQERIGTSNNFRRLTSCLNLFNLNMLVMHVMHLLSFVFNFGKGLYEPNGEFFPRKNDSKRSTGNTFSLFYKQSYVWYTICRNDYAFLIFLPKNKKQVT